MQKTYKRDLLRLLVPVPATPPPTALASPAMSTPPPHTIAPKSAEMVSA